MDERFLFPEAHLLRQFTKQIQIDFPFTGKESIKKVLDSLDDLLLIVDEETLIHYANLAAIRRFGGNPDQLIGKTLFEKMPFPQVKSRWQTILQALNRYGAFSFIDSAHGKHALSHILPFQDKSSTKTYYIIFTVESNSTELLSDSHASTDTVFEETFKVVHETSADYSSDPRLEYHLRISLALANAAMGASLAEDLPTAINALCTQACLALGAPAAVVRLYNPHQNTLEIAGSYGLSDEHIHKHFAIPYAPLAHLASEVAPRVAVVDLDQAPSTPADQLPYRQRLSASVVANIVRQNRFLGVLVILVPKIRSPLTKEDLLFVQAIAEQASISVDRFRLLETQEKRAKELEYLVRIGIELRGMLSKKDVLFTLLEKLAKDIYIKAGASYLIEKGRYVLTSSIGESQNLPQWLAIPDSSLWHDGKPLFFNHLSSSANLLTEGSHNPKFFDNICGLAIPLHTPSMTTGVILLFFSRPVRLSDDDQHKIYLLQEIGDGALYRADTLEHLEQLVLERTRELSILYEVTSILNSPTDLRYSIDQVLERVLSVARADYAAIHLYNPKKKSLLLYEDKSDYNPDFSDFLTTMGGDSPWETVFNQNSTLILDIPPIWGSEPPRFAERNFIYLGLPIRSKGEILGVLSLFSRTKEETYSLNDQVILTAISDQLGLAIERARLTEQGEEIAKLEERQRLARDLHDALTQSLYSMTLLTSGYKRSLHHATLEEIHQWMDELNDIAQNALAELRLLLYELRPTALEQDGLQGALKRRLDAVEKRAGIRTSLEVHGSFRLPPEDEEHFYRIAQEALNNALQHAHHHAIMVQIDSTPHRFQLLIADDGIGFDFDQVIQQNKHSGLNNMFTRASQIEARLSIESVPGKGTKLLIVKEYNHA